MSNPQQNNETFTNMNQSEPNVYLNNQNNNKVFFPAQCPIYTPVQPVPVVAQAGTPMAMPVNAQPPTYMVMQGQPQVIQAPQTNNNQKVIVIQEERRPKKSGRACYCKGPKQSPCGCCDPNEEYCCIVVVFAYILMSLTYILTCLFIWRLCRIGFRGGWC